MTWKDSYSIGIPAIDKQHKQLCEKIDDLYSACSAGKGASEILKTLDFLESYTIQHFSDEEKLQQSLKYPKHTQHKAMHTDFMSQVAKLKKELATSGATIPMVININHIVSSWLISHIMTVDKELKNYTV